MEDNKKLTRKEFIKTVLHFNLEKDLQENEIICPYCQGTGIQVEDNIYGIRGDTTHIGIHFPYKNQSLTFCDYCYNGVLKKCDFCGNVLTRANSRCFCEESEKERKNQEKLQRTNIWNDANKKTYDNRIKEGYKYFYCENIDYFFEEVEELIEELKEWDIELQPLRIYVCDKIRPIIYAEDIIENATAEMDESAPFQYDSIKLQKILNDYFDSEGYYSYVPNYDEGVLINNE